MFSNYGWDADAIPTDAIPTFNSRRQIRHYALHSHWQAGDNIMCNGVFTRSSKRPAIHVYFEYICWKFAGRLLDRVNTL